MPRVVFLSMLVWVLAGISECEPGEGIPTPSPTPTPVVTPPPVATPTPVPTPSPCPEQLYFQDRDEDGYGTKQDSISACIQPEGYVLNSDDCDDTDAAVHPGAEEVCDAQDNDCNGEVDDGLPFTEQYADQDGDGYGDSSTAVTACTELDGRVLEGGDCDDTDAAVHPGAEEVCDAQDNDCNGEVDEGLDMATWYLDADGDGFGNDEIQVEMCGALPGFAAQGGDCDDLNPAAYPGAEEVCDGADNDCDGVSDPQSTWYQDLDGDGYGNEAVQVEACEPQPDFVSARGDCDDSSPETYPGAEDAPGGADMDCGGTDGPDPSVGLPGSAYTSIQEALDAAVSGQTVWVGPGTYHELQLTMEGKELALRSVYGPEATVVDADNEAEVFLFVSGETRESLLDGFTIQHGTPVDGCPNFYDYICGGGIYLAYSGGTFRNLVVKENTHQYGPGLMSESSDVLITDSVFVGNGVGIWSDGGELLVRRTTVSDSIFNNMTIGGHFGIEDVAIVGGQGNGIVMAYSDGVLRRVSVSNVTGIGLCLLSGGYSAPVEIHQAVVTGSGDTGLYTSEVSSMVANSIFAGNGRIQPEDPEVAWEWGSGVGVESTPPILFNVIIAGNRGWYGGGVSAWGYALVTINTTIVGNQGEYGGAVNITNSGCHWRDFNSIIAYNSGDYAIECYREPEIDFNHTALHHPGGEVIDPDSCMEFGVRYLEEPEFLVDPVLDENGEMWEVPDYHLSLESPLVDAGTPEGMEVYLRWLVGHDYAPLPEWGWFDPDGSLPDLGAFGGPCAEVADVDNDGIIDCYGWDIDLDGVPGYWWPGTLDDAPDGFSPSNYDADDQDASVH